MITKFNTYIKENLNDNILINLYIVNTKSYGKLKFICFNDDFNSIFKILSKYGFTTGYIPDVDYTYPIITFNKPKFYFIMYLLQKEFEKYNITDNFKKNKFIYKFTKNIDTRIDINISLNDLEKIFSNIDFNINIRKFEKIIDNDISNDISVIDNEIIKMYLTKDLKLKYNYLFNAKNFDII